MRYPLLLLFLLCVHGAGAQATNRVWAFGWGCGVNFNTSPPTAISTSSNSFEGCASISDASGQLLLYVGGDTVYNRLHQPMLNGGDILGFGSSEGSCTQGNVIVPKPGSNHEYYIFALEGFTDNLPLGRLFYSLVDMNLDGGLGAVVSTQKRIQLDAGLGEKMTAVAGTCDNLWLLVVPKSNDQLRAYEITSAGVNAAPVVSSLAAAPGGYDIGTMKAAHNGTRIIAAQFSAAEFTLFDFDQASGIISNPLSFTNGSVFSPYACSFSPDDSKLYLLFDSIYQYDLSFQSPAAILNSRTGIVQASFDPPYTTWDMQTAPDGKLYIAKILAGSLACIPNPNASGTACGFIPSAISLTPGSVCGAGMPNTVVNATVSGQPVLRTFDTVTCHVFHAVSSGGGPYPWNTGDTTAAIQISKPGVYWVYAAAGCAAVDTFRVYTPDCPQYLTDVAACMGDPVAVSVQLSLPNTASVLWSNGSSGNEVTFNDTGTYTVEIKDGFCTCYDTMRVSLKPCGCDFFFPNAFSPNGDGLNDFFLPKFFLEHCNGLEEFQMQIFNRWGERVYMGTETHKGWDGRYKGSYADSGVYMFLIRYRDRNGISYSKKGDLILVR